MLLFDLYSAQPVGSSTQHGGGEYIKAIFERAAGKFDSSDIAVCFNKDAFLDQWLTDLIDVRAFRSYQVSSHADIIKLVTNTEFDSFFTGAPYWLTQEQKIADTHVIGTVHGLRPIECPTDRYESAQTRGIAFTKALIKKIFPAAYLRRQTRELGQTLANLDTVITDSWHSYYAIKCTYPQQERIEVLYAPAKHAEAPIAVECLDDKNFILMVSCNRWEKNPVRATRALDELFSKGELPGVVVACCGVTGGRLFKSIKNKDRFMPLGYVTTGQLEWLYKNCRVLLYPSLNEGFGYPPLEAMKYGTTCIVSGVCSLPEICGDAAYYVNPLSIKEIETRVLEALDVPIDERRILSHYNLIKQKQERDLDKLVNLLQASVPE